MPNWRNEYRRCDNCRSDYRPQREAQSYCSRPDEAKSMQQKERPQGICARLAALSSEFLSCVTVSVSDLADVGNSATAVRCIDLAAKLSERGEVEYKK